MSTSQELLQQQSKKIQQQLNQKTFNQFASTGLPGLEEWLMQFGGQGHRQTQSLQEFYDLGVEGLEQTPGTQPGFRPTNSNFLDELGFSEGLPGKYSAPLVQYLSQKKVAQRNQKLREQAQGLLRGVTIQGQNALETLGAYRPGSAAQLASGAFQLTAQGLQGEAQGLYGQQTEAPNLMFEFDRESAKQAVRSARRAQTNQLVGAGITAIGSLFGGWGAAAGAALGNRAGSSGTYGAQGSPGVNYGSGASGPPVGPLGPNQIRSEGGGLTPNLAEGGIVPPKPGGTEVTVGEGGEAEVVIPLSKLPAIAAQIQGREQDARPPAVGPGADAQQGGGLAAPAGPALGQGASAQGSAAAGGSGAMMAMPDMGGDGFSQSGAAHMVGNRLGIPTDVLHAAIVDMEFDPRMPTMAEQLNDRLEDLMTMDEILRAEALA